MSSQPLLDWQPEASRDEALQRVRDNEPPPWFEQAMLAAKSIATEMPGAVVTGEDVRFALEQRLPLPHHHNIWGSVIRELTRRGILERTGNYRRMRGPKSNARETPEYRLVR